MPRKDRLERRAIVVLTPVSVLREPREYFRNAWAASGHSAGTGLKGFSSLRSFAAEAAGTVNVSCVAGMFGVTSLYLQHSGEEKWICVLVCLVILQKDHEGACCCVFMNVLITYVIN